MEYGMASIGHRRLVSYASRIKEEGEEDEEFGKLHSLI